MEEELYEELPEQEADYPEDLYEDLPANELNFPDSTQPYSPDAGITPPPLPTGPIPTYRPGGPPQPTQAAPPPPLPTRAPSTSLSNPPPIGARTLQPQQKKKPEPKKKGGTICLLYTSDAADE